MSQPLMLGPIGIWTRKLDDQPARKAQEAASELEELGYGAIWFGEAAGREALTNAGLLLAGTTRIVIATGIEKQVVLPAILDADHCLPPYYR
jgi:alkanesulfonate monooxygenase SsuD/methylene tetrahydromethanopterin reductase-like flavin-dependent oxidoreductase (luciferase family)